MRETRFLLISIVLLACQACQGPPPELVCYADLVLHNGKVLTVDPSFSVAEAVAVRDGKILAVGSNAEILRLAGPSTRKVDLAGKTVTPGFVVGDADNTFVGGDLYKETTINGKVMSRHKVPGDSLAEVLANAKQLIAQAEPGTLVYLRMEEKLKSELAKLTARDLDKLAPDNPLMMNLTSSEGIVNSAMLERAFAAGLRRDHFSVVKDSRGRPTGQLFGQALGMLGSNLKDWPELTEEIFKQQEDLLSTRLRFGVTTLSGHISGYTLTVMSELFHRGRLKARIRPDMDVGRQNPLTDQFLRRTPNLVDFGLGDGMVRIAGAAIGPFDGGSDAGDISTNEAKLKVHPEIGGGPYGRSKWLGTQWNGKQWADLTEAEKRDTDWAVIQLLRKHGWNIGGIHNMGSGAATAIMESLAEAEQQPGMKVHDRRRRHMLDHNLIWDSRSIELARQLGDNIAFGLAAELFDQRTLAGEEALIYQYGEERMHTMQPVKDLLQAGLIVQLEDHGDDSSPMWRVQRYITRTDDSGRVWGADQALDRQQALRCVTINGARFVSEEDMLGSIEKGKYADLVVFDGDYMTVPEQEIQDLTVAMTIVGGNVVYESGR